MQHPHEFEPNNSHIRAKQDDIRDLTKPLDIAAINYGIDLAHEAALAARRLKVLDAITGKTIRPARYNFKTEKRANESGADHVVYKLKTSKEDSALRPASVQQYDNVPRTITFDVSPSPKPDNEKYTEQQIPSISMRRFAHKALTAAEVVQPA